MEMTFHCAIFPFSNVGRRMAAASSRSRTCIRATRKRARETWAFIGCKSMTSARPECTGNFTKWAPATASVITSAVSGCQLQSHWAVIRFIHSRQLRRCRTVWTNCFSLGSCEENQSSLSAAKPSISMCRQTSILFWKVMCSPARCVQKVHLAITPGSILQSRCLGRGRGLGCSGGFGRRDRFRGRTWSTGCDDFLLIDPSHGVVPLLSKG